MKTYKIIGIDGLLKGTFEQAAKIETNYPASNVVTVYSDTELIGIVNLGPGEIIALVPKNDDAKL